MELICERRHAKLYRAEPWNYYEITLPELNDKEKELIDLINKTIVQKYKASELGILFLKDKERVLFIERIKDLLAELNPYFNRLLAPDEENEVIKIISGFIKQVAPYVEHKNEVIYSIFQDVLGFGKLSFFIEDDELEEIMANGIGQPIFVFDRTYGLCKTSIGFESDSEIMGIINRVSEFVAKKINRKNPILDARLPDRSRFNATIPPASPMGPTITIRKFRRKPLTITEIIKNNTLSSELAAFLWLCIEGLLVDPKSLIIAGNIGGGKTTTLNALSVFIPQRERIVTIEDTLELNLNRENWVQLEVRPGIRERPVSMDDLLKNAIRMRPDRVIVGEVRGREAEQMFITMDIGHPSMGTIHANSAREAILRLQSPPMNVPSSMFILLDLIVMQHRQHLAKKGIVRRITQVSEVSVMENRVLLSDLYLLDREKDRICRTSTPSNIIEQLCFHTGLEKKEIEKELLCRKAVLDYLVKNDITDGEAIQKTILSYYSDREKFLSRLGAKTFS